MRNYRPGSPRMLALVAVALVAGAVVALLTPPAHHRRAAAPGSSLSIGGDGGRLPSSTTLSLARAIGQLFVIGVSGQSASPTLLSEVRREDWGGIVLGRSNYTSPAQVGALTTAIDNAARDAGHDAPLIVARQGGGQSSAFSGLAPASEPDLGALGRADLVNGQSQLAARELRALHVGATLAPVADLADLAGPAAGRAFSPDPALTAKLVRAAVTGYREGAVISIVGHFPGEGAASQDPSQGAATVGLSLPDLMARDVVPFRAVVGSAAMIQMSAATYAAFDGVTPATLAPAAVSLLRDQLGYRGVIVSADLGAVTVTTASSVGQAAIAALRAGVDLLYVPDPAAAGRAYDAVFTALRNRALDPQAIAHSVARIVAIKRAYGIR